jgi:hypothetical protein
MITPKSKLASDIFNELVLSSEEMIFVRGGEIDPTTKPTNPPVVI